MLKITLDDGTTIAAKNLTDTSYLAIASLFFDDSEDASSLQSILANSGELSQRILRNLRSADAVKTLAFGIVTVFPDIPADKVWFDDPTRKPSYGVAGLSVGEIMRIAIASAQELQELATFRPKPKRRDRGFASNSRR